MQARRLREEDIGGGFRGSDVIKGKGRVLKLDLEQRAP
jgi:hypothetical protein